VPRLLSLLAFNQLNGTVKGINDLNRDYQALYGPGDYVPPVAMSYWTFRLMVGAGFLMLAGGAYALLLVMGEQLDKPPRLLRFFPYLIALPYLANSTGWLLTELGRAPWVVFGVMKIEDAISPNLTAGMVLTTLIVFTLVYAALMAADVYLLVDNARRGSAEVAPEPVVPEGISLVGD
jgi:cytochrome d ubiquinol oxidase subunit I